MFSCLRFDFGSCFFWTLWPVEPTKLVFCHMFLKSWRSSMSVHILCYCLKKRLIQVHHKAKLTLAAEMRGQDLAILVSRPTLRLLPVTQMYFCLARFCLCKLHSSCITKGDRHNVHVRLAPQQHPPPIEWIISYLQSPFITGKVRSSDPGTISYALKSPSFSPWAPWTDVNKNVSL